MTWPSTNGDDEEPYIPMARRPAFRLLAAVVTIIVVLAMLALTLGPYLVGRSGTTPRTTTTVLQV